MRFLLVALPLAAACGPGVAFISNEETPVGERFPTFTLTGSLPVRTTIARAAPLPLPSMQLSVGTPWLAAAGVDAPVDAGVDAPIDAGVSAGPASDVPDGGPRGLDVSPHLALGLPDSSGVGQPTRWLLVRPQFVSSYDTSRKVPNWTSWKLDSSDFGQATRATTFRTDALLPTGTPQARDDDYRLSGFDRGHLCPSADRTSTDANNDATFFLTNVVPQTHASNAGPWLDLEDEARQLASQGKRLVIIAGPLFGATRQAIGAGVEVPVSLFKVAVVMDATGTVTSTTRVYAAIIPNAAVLSGSWRQWQVTARSIEQQTGLDFMSDLPPATQELLETRLDP